MDNRILLGYAGCTMRVTRLFSKTSKTPPHDAETANARLLLQAGFVHQEMAGVYSWLPLGLKVLHKVEHIIREEMDALGAQEIRMTALQPKENWMTSGRWDSVDVLFKVPSQTQKEYALGATHEEIVTPLVGAYLKSYKDLPIAVYQIQTKFRDELRAKSGVLRGREFGMKDLYSFHANQADLEVFYGKVLEAYVRIFKRCGLDVKVVEASGGAFSEKFSHEFQVLTDAGEDMVLACSQCMFGQNTEVATLKDGDVCPRCGGVLNARKGVEAGNIFDLGTKFSEPFHVEFTDENGERKTALMGCYGLGTTRLVGTIVEACHDARGMMWPKQVAPMQVHLIHLRSKDPVIEQNIQEVSSGLYEDLKREGVEVVWDDREASPGEKLADADLMGIPLRILVSEKTMKEGAIEWKERSATESELIPISDVVEDILAFVKN